MMVYFWSLTCDDQTFIMVQGFSEEARNNELGIDQKTDFLLNQTRTGDASSNKLIGKIHLKIKTDELQ